MKRSRASCKEKSSDDEDWWRLLLLEETGKEEKLKSVFPYSNPPPHRDNGSSIPLSPTPILQLFDCRHPFIQAK